MWWAEEIPAGTVGQTFAGATDNKSMNQHSDTHRRLFVPALALISAALLTLGTRYPPAIASCGRPAINPEAFAVALSAQPPVEDGAGAELCPSTLPDAPTTSAQPALPPNYDLSQALAAALGPAGLTGPPLPASLPSTASGSPLRSAFSAPPASQSGFIWPVVGPITQAFGVPELGVGLPHTGLDIGKDSGSPVRAAQAGRVVFAGGDPCCGLGYWIEVNHGNHFATRYGHLMRPPLLLKGDYVTQGQILGFSGTTGFSTGPHLHLEVRRDGIPIDPLTVLPRP
jgi:murein DD-endopeptidase MepM/ murein hydrolase activator NlpD